MIELELKYEIKSIPNKIKKIEIIKQKQQEDIYYDTNNYDLIQRGNFFRIRNKKRLEFKLFAGDTSHLFCQETDFDLDKISINKEQINNILSSINLKNIKDLNNINQIIDTNNLKVLAPIKKHRTSYKYNENSTISIDEVDNLGLFLEAEIMIDKETLSKDEANTIKEEFINDLKKSKILTNTEKQVNIGYVELYLLKHNKEAYNLGIYKI